MRFLLAIALAGSLFAGCKTTSSNKGYDYNKSHEASSSDGVPHGASSRSQQVRNAFGF